MEGELGERYRLVKKLGHGNTGTVYLAEHILIGRREALKVLRPELGETSVVVARFRREARAIKRLNHPNIVGVYDFGQLPDGRFYMTTEYADGERLDQILAREGPLPIDRTLDILGQLSDAAAHAHGCGVIHHDIKPSNLALVADQGRNDMLKVFDFGIAKILDPDDSEISVVTNDRAILGTPRYIAPELALGVRHDARSDIYAIGCLAYELLIGQPPFTGKPTEVVRKHVQDPAPSARATRSDVPPELDAIIFRCMAKSPAERFPTAASIAAAIRTVPGFGKPERGRVKRDTMLGGPTFDVPVAELREALRLAAEALLDAGCEAIELVLAATEAEQLNADLHVIDSEAAEIERRRDVAAKTTRTRERALRLALGELRLHNQQRAARGEPPDPEAAARIDAIELRVKELVDEVARLGDEISDQAVTLANRRDGVERVLDEVYEALERVIGANFYKYNHVPGVASAVDQVHHVRARIGSRTSSG